MTDTRAQRTQEPRTLAEGARAEAERKAREEHWCGDPEVFVAGAQWATDAADGTQPGCTGAGNCPAPAHLHGCFADTKGHCNDPGDHPATATSDYDALVGSLRGDIDQIMREVREQPYQTPDKLHELLGIDPNDTAHALAAMAVQFRRQRDDLARQLAAVQERIADACDCGDAACTESAWREAISTALELAPKDRP